MEQSGSCNDLQNTFAINENEHKNEINEYKRDFHLFNVYYYAPSHSLTLTKSNTHTHMQNTFLLRVLHFTKNLYIAYHVKYMMGKCIPKVLWCRQKIIKTEPPRYGCQKVSMKHGMYCILNKTARDSQVTGIILFKAYILYASYGSDHVYCKHTDRFEMTIFTSKLQGCFP